MNADSETKALQRSLYRSKVERARVVSMVSMVSMGSMGSMGSKLFAGVALFDRVRARMLCGIRSQCPAWSDAEIEAEFSRRLTARRERQQRGIYTPVAD